MKKNTDQLNVFGYLDYREFLKDVYNLLKEKNAKYSQRYFAQKLGVKSTGFFAEVLNGKRNLTHHYTLRFIALLEMDDDESHYFENLVNFNQAHTILEKDHWLLKMMESSKVDPTLLNRDVYEYFSKWYYAAIREVLFFYRKPFYPNVIAEMLSPSISTDAAAQALKLLERLQLIECKEDGSYLQKDSVVSTGEQVKSVEVANYQMQTIDLAKNALNTVPSSLRDFSTLTMSISPEAYEDIAAVLKKTRQEIIKITQKDSAEDRVYQMNIQLYPLTKIE